MNSRYFVRLALQNIDKHRQTYLPYMVALSSFVSMFYILLFLRNNDTTTQYSNDVVFDYLLSGSAYVFGFFVVVFLIYCNNFLIRHRTKEFSLLYLFGLSQRHLMIIMTYEVMIVYSVSIAIGLTAGIILSRLMNMVLATMIKTQLSIPQLINVDGVLITTGLFVGAMCVVLLINIFQIINAKPVSLTTHIDQHKPSKWRQYVLLVIGLLCIGYAYAAIVLVDSPQEAYGALATVLLSILIGTFCLFVSLSATILPIFAQRPAIYYQPNNFIIINGLINRIRYNAIGLASVSMFALMILVMISMSAVIYFGADASVQKMYAADVIVTAQEHNIISKSQLREHVQEVIASQGVTAQFTEAYTFLSLATIQSGTSFVYEESNRTFVGDTRSHYMVLLTMDEYNTMYNDTLQLAPDEVAVYSSYLPLPDTFALQGITYHVVKRIPYLSIADYDLVQLVNAHFVVVYDDTVLKTHEYAKYLQKNDHPSPIRYRVGINLDGDANQYLAVFKALQQNLATDMALTRAEQYPSSNFEIVNIQSRQAEKVVFEAVYGTFLFLSLFLGVLFVMSTALLIYYKQLSEGYEDKARFEILQRIGMTSDEVRVSVDTQIVVLFFIPLLVAGMHFVISLNLIRHLLELFRITNIQLLISSALITFLAFSIIYLVIYRVSARVYYHIVR